MKNWARMVLLALALSSCDLYPPGPGYGGPQSYYGGSGYYSVPPSYYPEPNGYPGSGGYNGLHHTTQNLMGRAQGRPNAQPSAENNWEMPRKGIACKTKLALMAGAAKEILRRWFRNSRDRMAT